MTYKQMQKLMGWCNTLRKKNKMNLLFFSKSGIDQDGSTQGQR